MDETPIENGKTENEKKKNPPLLPSRQKQAPPEIITVEHSLSAISDLLKEIEPEDIPTQTQPEEETGKPQIKVSSYRHRFALYRKNTSVKSNVSQINAFRSFAKSLKSTDNPIQILPIRTDLKVNSLSTTDQINHLEPVGLSTYFKPYRYGLSHLSGDYFITSILPFEELHDHATIQTRLAQNGYSMLLNACQTSDMVRIGFLSRVRSFTFCDDLHAYITSSSEWKQTPFHFRMYFDAFGTKGNIAFSYCQYLQLIR